MGSLAASMCRQKEDWPGTAVGLQRFSLRFPEAAQEQGFVLSRQAKLTANLQICATVAFLLCAYSMAALLFLFGWARDGFFPTDMALRQSRAKLFCLGIAGAVSVVVVAAARCPKFVRLIGPLAFECFTVASLMLVMTLTVISNTWYLCRLWGEDPTSVWREKVVRTDSGMLLTIDGIVAVAHIALPVRWSMMLPFEVLGVLLYALLVALGSPEEQAITNLAMLTGLIVTAAVGKRGMELSDRVAFSQLVQERVLRCDAEFQLAQLDGQDGPGRQSQQSNAGSESAAETTSTGRVFELDGEAEMAGQLANIGELGRREHWLLATAEVELQPDRVLGQGGFGIVVSGVFCSMPVAVKLARDFCEAGVERRLSALANELRILRQLRHPNIVIIHGAVVDLEQKNFGLVLEMVHGQTFDGFLGLQGSGAAPAPDESARFQVCLGVCRAFLYLHTRKPCIVHGDLKSSNILVEEAGREARPKLLDFGLARVLTRDARPLGGTLPWMAPECFQASSQRPRCSADVFSLGMLLCVAATRMHPRNGMSPQELKRALRTRQPIVPKWPEGSAFQPHCRPLVEACLSLDESLRPDIGSICGALSTWPGLLGIPEPLGCGRAQGWHEVMRSLASLRPRAEAVRAPPPVPERPRSADQQRPLSRLPTVEEESRPGTEGGDQTPEPRPSPNLMDPSMRPTTETAMLASICQLCTRWNHEVPRDACCALHAGVRLLIRHTQTLEGFACRGWTFPDSVQCSSCGIIAHASGGICDICGHELRAEPSPRNVAL